MTDGTETPTYAQPTPRCSVCNETGTVTLTADQVRGYEAWKRKEGRIQDLLPDISVPLREQIMSGTHPDCWESLFNPTECGTDCDGSSHPGLWCR